MVVTQSQVAPTSVPRGNKRHRSRKIHSTQVNFDTTNPSDLRETEETETEPASVVSNRENATKYLKMHQEMQQQPSTYPSARHRRISSLEQLPSSSTSAIRSLGMHYLINLICMIF